MTGLKIALIIVGAVVALVLILFIIMAIRARTAKPKTNVLPEQKNETDLNAAAEILCRIVKVPSVTPLETDPEGEHKRNFSIIHDILAESYSFLRAAEQVALDKARIYIMRGTAQNAGAVGISGHLDVVPEGDTSLWQFDPYSGSIADGYLYGRGAMDMKGQVVAFLSAYETLYKKGIKHQKDVYFLITHDEETVNDGAREIVAYLKKKGVRFDFTLDEGGVLFDGSSFGIKETIAFIGVNEKGYMDVKITAREARGHSAIPPAETAIENISKAVTGIQYKKSKAHFNEAFNAMIKRLLPHMSFFYRLIFANLWLTGGIVKAIMGRTPETNALIRTTVAPTILRAGDFANVLPEKAEAVFNCRINAPDTMATTERYIKERIDEKIELTILQGNDPTAVSVTDCAEFDLIRDIITATYGGKLIAAPYQVVASTDSHEYYAVTDKAYRFVPFLCFKEDMGLIHSENERLELESLRTGIEFYMNVIRAI